MTDQNETRAFNPDEIPCQEISDPAVLSKTPLVSVKMITYNHEPYIAQAIKGVLMQETDFPIELIIGEDCSTDRTRQIVLHYQKEHPDIIRVITSDENVGMNKNSWRTEKACRGKYVAYCEGDDFWIHPKKLQMQAGYLEAHPECGLVHADNDRLWHNAGIIERSIKRKQGVSPRKTEDPFTQMLLQQYRITTSTICLRKELLDRCAHKEGHLFIHPKSVSGELVRWLYMSIHSTFHYLNESVSTYRILQESASHSQSNPRRVGLALAEWVSYVCMHYANKYACPPHVRKAVEIQNCSTQLMLAYHKRDSFEAKQAYEKLKTLGHRLSTRQWAFLLGAHSRTARILTIPLVLLRRMWIQASRKRTVRRRGSRIEDGSTGSG